MNKNRCAVCRKWFTPANSGQRACSVICGRRLSWQTRKAIPKTIPKATKPTRGKRVKAAKPVEITVAVPEQGVEVRFGNGRLMGTLVVTPSGVKVLTPRQKVRPSHYADWSFLADTCHLITTIREGKEIVK